MERRGGGRRTPVLCVNSTVSLSLTRSTHSTLQPNKLAPQSTVPPIRSVVVHTLTCMHCSSHVRSLHRFFSLSLSLSLHPHSLTSSNLLSSVFLSFSLLRATNFFLCSLYRARNEANPLKVRETIGQLQRQSARFRSFYCLFNIKECSIVKVIQPDKKSAV